MVEKNRDRIRPEAMDMLFNSGIEGVATMFLPANGKGRRGAGQASGANSNQRFGRSPTLLDSFHTSLLALMDTMEKYVWKHS